MPRTVIVYTNNLDRNAEISGLFHSLCSTMRAPHNERGKQVFPTGGTRVVAYPVEDRNLGPTRTRR